MIALFAIALTSAAAASVAVSYSNEERRRKEAELLRVGEEIRGAIEQYYRRSPGSVPRYPLSLDDLLDDRRYLSLQRYLRRIHIDPFSGRAEWGTVPAPEGGIMGVFSLSAKPPIKRTGFPVHLAHFANATSYREWTFVYVPRPATLLQRGSGVASK